MYSTSELDELFQILNSIKGFKHNNHKGATQQYHDEDDDEICEINQITRDNKAKNNACWKCGKVGHFAWECPSNESKTQDRYAGKYSILIQVLHQ